MPGLLYFAIGVVALVIENLWRVHLPILGLAPQLTLLVVLFPAHVMNPLRGLFLAFIFGFALDALGGNLPGMNAVVFVACFF
ncbi:MAG: rod shape-determining protein MreD [Deltaproteobacteria bacterium]|nr:rod shape-determining protein MreD [Deltaproteobacteria bacterium]